MKRLPSSFGRRCTWRLLISRRDKYTNKKRHDKVHRPSRWDGFVCRIGLCTTSHGVLNYFEATTPCSAVEERAALAGGSSSQQQRAAHSSPPNGSQAARRTAAAGSNCRKQPAPQPPNTVNLNWFTIVPCNLKKNYSEKYRLHPGMKCFFCHGVDQRFTQIKVLFGRIYFSSSFFRADSMKLYQTVLNTTGFR